MEQAQGGVSERRLVTYLALGLAVAVICAYALIVRADFINYDDNSHVFENPLVTGGLSWKGIVEAFTQPRASLWLPLTWISFMTDVSLFGLNPGAMHAVNLLWHVATTVLLFLTLRRMTGEVWASAFVAALFGLHPINVESVAWITERKNVLCAFFWVAAIAAYARYAERPNWRSYTLSLVAASFALLSKASAVTLPCTLLLLDFWPLCRLRTFSWKRLAGEKLPFFVLTVVISWLALTAQREASVVSFTTVTLAGRASNALVSYMAYLGQLVWPVNLAIFYPHPVHSQPIAAATSLLLIATVSALAYYGRKRHPYVLVGWLWFLGTLVPMIGLVQVGSQARADRFTYISQIGVFVAVTWWGLARGARSSRVVGGLAAAVLLASGLLTAHQVRYWMDGATLFEHAIAVTRDNACAYANAGLHRARAGDYPRAAAHFKESLRIQPDQSMIWREFGTVLLLIGKPQEAVTALRSALQFHPGDYSARYQLAIAYLKSGATDDAIQALEGILREVPNSAGAHFHLALALEAAGRLEEARAHLKDAVRLKSQDPKLADQIAKQQAP